jgi:hypothetical protein
MAPRRAGYREVAGPVMTKRGFLRLLGLAPIAALVTAPTPLTFTSGTSKSAAIEVAGLMTLGEARAFLESFGRSSC